MQVQTHAPELVSRTMDSPSDIKGGESPSSTCPTDNASTTDVSTPLTSAAQSTIDTQDHLQDLTHHIPLGCLRYDKFIDLRPKQPAQDDWHELLFLDLPDEIKEIIHIEATNLLEYRWIKLFLHQPNSANVPNGSLLRLYLLPEDWGRRFVDRGSRTLKNALRDLLPHIDISPHTWSGTYDNDNPKYFDPWASGEQVSLYYLFNMLPSPAPNPELIKNRYTRAAVYDMLKSAAHSEWEEHGEQPLEGLRTRLYPFQARSASLMLQKEAAPQLQLDPRLEVRTAPTGEKFWFGARDGSFLQEPRYYESNRGGILAETMGLGKTVICLAVILATQGHYPQIPPMYLPPSPVRKQVGGLGDMAASVIGRYSIPARALLKSDYSLLIDKLDENVPFYEVPLDRRRWNRLGQESPPRQFVMCSSTIIVVPRNLLHQWQSEIRKHVLMGGIKILVVDSVSKRGSKMKATAQDDELMTHVSELPRPSDLMKYDVVLFSRTRFEQEMTEGVDERWRKWPVGMNRACTCPCIGKTRLPDCNCRNADDGYESPLTKLHWLRLIVDEGHSFSSSASDAVRLTKMIRAERRWVVSGTPAKNLVGAEVDLSIQDGEDVDVMETTLSQRKAFDMGDENAKAAKALGALAAHFLMVLPWCTSGDEGKLEWTDYIYRHEDPYKKTYSGFSQCFLRTLEGLVIKTRPEDVERDIVLPPMTHRVIYLKPCWYDKMTANLFVQVLRANAITSERTGVDYLFHKNSIKARHSLIRNLRQSNFTWTGFSLADVSGTLESSTKYMSKEDKVCTMEDAESLLESCKIISMLANSDSWKALSKAHEVGMAVKDWPEEFEEAFALTYPEKPTMIGITQLLDGQLHVDSNISTGNPTLHLDIVGQAAKAKVIALAEAENEKSVSKDKALSKSHLLKPGVPSSAVGTSHASTSHRAPAATPKSSPTKKTAPRPGDLVSDVTPKSTTAASPMRPKKRKLTLSDELASLPEDSSLLKTRVVGTSSAKLTYLLDKIMEHQATEKIIVFYDGDNAAYYIAQCLEFLYINHRIYARTLDNSKRSEYVKLFNEDPDVRVLLIDVACGALGLNLNAASVVLIVNPINRPGIEAQAIKRAHRIGQTRKVLVETLVLEGTIEHAIFNRAKNMSRAQHLEAKQLEDDEGITEIIQNAQVFPVEQDEGLSAFALLEKPQQVFGRPNRDKYHRFGHAEPKTPKKKRKTSEEDLMEDTIVIRSPPTAIVSPNVSTNGNVSSSSGPSTAVQSSVPSVFGSG